MLKGDKSVCIEWLEKSHTVLIFIICTPLLYLHILNPDILLNYSLQNIWTFFYYLKIIC